MGERTEAKQSIETSTKHLNDIAHELSRRASPRYIGDQAKETVLNKTIEWKDQIGTSPMALGLIGGALGALIGRAFAKERLTRSYAHSQDFSRTQGLESREPYIERVAWSEDRNTQRDGSSSIGDKIGEQAHSLAAGAHDLRDKATAVAGSIRDGIPSAVELGRKGRDNPMMVAVGGLVMGVVAAMLLPVSRKEHELLEPLKQRAGEALGSLGEKIDATAQQAKQQIAGKADGASPQQTISLAEITH